MGTISRFSQEGPVVSGGPNRATSTSFANRQHDQRPTPMIENNVPLNARGIWCIIFSTSLGLILTTDLVCLNHLKEIGWQVLSNTGMEPSEVVAQDHEVLALKAPGDFKVKAVATGLTSALIVVFVPDNPNGDLDQCYGDISSPRGDKHTFTCDNHGGRASTIELEQLERGTEYTGTVTFANVQGTEEAAAEKRFTITTHSGAHGDFVVEATATRPESALIVVFAPEETNGDLQKCYGEIRNLKGEGHSFSCEQRVGRSSTVHLKGLQPGSTYNGHVVFANMHNNEEVTTREEFTLKTSIAAPGDFKVQAAATGLTSALIVVFVPDNPNGDLDKCYGDISSLRGDKHTFTCDNHGGRASAIELDQLERGTEYTGTVTFVNVQGTEEAAAEKRFTITTHSGAPGDFEVEVQVTGTSSAVIVVHVPKEKNGPLDMCYGEIKSPQGDIRNFSCKNHGGRSSTITLDELQAGTEYSAVVTFANVHQGQHVKAHKKFTLKTHSTAPGDFVVEAKPTGTSSLEVVVFAPSEPNGALDECYGVLWEPEGLEHHFTCNDHGGRSSTVTLGGLQPGTLYQGQVTFVNIYEGKKMAAQKSVSVKTSSLWMTTEVLGLLIFLFCVVILSCSGPTPNNPPARAIGR